MTRLKSSKLVLTNRLRYKWYQRLNFFKTKLRNQIYRIRILDKGYVLCTALLKSQTLRKYRLISARECCEKNNWSYVVIERAVTRKVCKPCYFEKCEETIEKFISPDIYIAEFHNVFVVGGVGAIFTQTECIYDALARDKEERYDVRFSALKYRMGNYVEVMHSRKSKEIKEAIFLVGFASYNYYHITVEILSRLKYVDSLEKYRYLPILIDEVVMEMPQIKQLLSRINTFNHPVILVGDMGIKVERLIYPSMNTWMPINVKHAEMAKNSDYQIAETAVYNIRECAKEIFSPSNHLKLFISRKNLKNVRLENEEEIRGIFERNGYEVIFPENMTYEEQVAYFSEAKIVVCATGAVLTNIIYCMPNTIIGCIIPEEYHFYLYSTIGKLLNLRNIYLDAEVTERAAYFSANKYIVNKEYCLRYIKKVEAILSEE